MSISDCVKCWSTPCDCGWEYRKMSVDGMIKFIGDILQYRSKEESKEILNKAVEYIDGKDDWTEDDKPIQQ